MATVSNSLPQTEAAVSMGLAQDVTGTLPGNERELQLMMQLLKSEQRERELAVSCPRAVAQRMFRKS